MKEVTKIKAGGDGEYVESFSVSYSPERIGRWIVDIDGPIEHVGQFRDAIRVFEMSDEENPVQINLQTPGGSVGAADALVHAMRKCKGHIHIVATGGVHSAGTLILLEADSFELSENFHSLIHCGSTGAGGNLNEFVAQTSFYSTHLTSMFRNVYEGFLTESEIDGMLKGQDIWLDADGWMERWNNRNEYFKAKAEAANKPARKPRKKKSGENVPTLLTA